MAFLPDALGQDLPLSWVAVVDVVRFIHLPVAVGGRGLAASIRSAPNSMLKSLQVFAIAVCRVVLVELQSQLPAERALA